ncbi:MAG: class IIb bacteriocin, lactobin A/cerein 7B family [Bacteroidales bacterium]|nr:class IIb bacteriocin, lactobin A/cerein 7B family [Bacteroidales bacterium]
MKNLAELGVQELNAQEMKTTDGGFWQFVAGAIVGGIIYDGYKGAYNACADWAKRNHHYMPGSKM